MEQINEINEMKTLIIKFNSILERMRRCDILKYPSRYEENHKGRQHIYMHFTNINLRELRGRESERQFYKFFKSKFTNDEKKMMWRRNGELERYTFILETPTYNRIILGNMINELTSDISKM